VAGLIFNASMPTATSPATSATSAYAELRRHVETVLREGRRAAEAAAIEASWRAGRLIHEHVLRYEDRADYGARTLRRLAGDVNVSDRALYRCWLFGRAYEISPPAAKLTCAHYFALSRLGDGPQRRALTAAAEKRGWVAKELEKRVTAVLDGRGARTAAPVEPIATPTPSATPAPRLLQPKLGTMGLYRLIARDDRLMADAGFKLYLPLAPAQARGRSAGQIVRVSGEGDIAAAAGATPADLFTYAATIRRVIDGDTLAVTVTLPHYEMDEKLRLRGIDCPEIATARGAAAKRHVESLVSAATDVAIATSKVDKYDRYLADVHLRIGEKECARLSSHSRDDAGWLHLNNALLVDGFAQRADSASVGDWVP
jgi:endonuclease YncB( thermonuclease family)